MAERSPHQMTEFEANLDCEIRFHSCSDDDYDCRLADHMEAALRDFWSRNPAPDPSRGSTPESR